MLELLPTEAEQWAYPRLYTPNNKSPTEAVFVAQITQKMISLISVLAQTREAQALSVQNTIKGKIEIGDLLL